MISGSQNLSGVSNDDDDDDDEEDDVHNDNLCSGLHGDIIKPLLTTIYAFSFVQSFFLLLPLVFWQLLANIRICRFSPWFVFGTAWLPFAGVHCKITHTNPPRQYRESIACNPHLKTTYAVYQTLSFMIRCQMILSFYLLKVRALIKI